MNSDFFLFLLKLWKLKWNHDKKEKCSMVRVPLLNGDSAHIFLKKFKEYSTVFSSEIMKIRHVLTYKWVACIFVIKT